MKKLVLIAALTALAACSQKADEAPAVAETAMASDTTAATSDAVPMAVDGKPDAGTYDSTGPDGKITKQTINADGTIVLVTDGKTSKGTWTKKGAADYCITMEGQTAPTCYTDTMDGTTWRSTNDADPKDTYTIVRTS